jgi:hypothetical protein
MCCSFSRGAKTAVDRRGILRRLIEAVCGRSAVAVAADQLSFCELERRRVLSVNATFLNGILSIDLAPGLDPSVDAAALIVGSDAQTFLVDVNGNGTSDPGELTGAIGDLERLVVDGENGYGRFGWYGNFTGANFDDSSLASINIRGLNEVILGAEVDTPGFISVRNIAGPVQLGGEASYAGVAYVGSLSVEKSMNIVGNSEVFTGTNVNIHVGENLLIDSDSDVNLANENGDTFRVTGHTQIFAGNGLLPKSVQIGEQGTVSGTGPVVDLNRVSIVGVEAILHDVNDVELDQIDVDQLSVYTGGRISDRVVARIDVAGASLFEASGLEIATGEFNTGTLEFRINGSAIVEEASDTDFVGTNRAGNLKLVSSGAIGDQPFTTIAIDGPALFAADDGIRLADATNNAISISGHAEFLAGDVNARSVIAIGLDGTQTSASPRVDLFEVSMLGSIASVYEVNDVVLRQVDLTEINLFAGENITDLATSRISVSGASLFEAGGINLGIGVFNSGTVEFRTMGDTTLNEASGMNLVGTNRAQNVDLRSAGSIEDAPQASLTASENLIAVAAENILLANHSNSALEVAGNASFSAGIDIEIGLNPGIANFGSLSLFGADVEIREASTTHFSAGPLNALSSVLVNKLTLSSTNLITQDAAITVAGNSLFYLQQTGDVLLARSTDPGMTVGSGVLMDNRFERSIDISTASDVLGDVAVRDITDGGPRLLGTVPSFSADDLVVEADTASLEILLPNRSLEVVAKDLRVAGNLQVVVGMDGDGVFPLLATADRSITDGAGASVTVGGAATLRSSGDVVLADQVGDGWRVTGDLLVVAGYDLASGFVGQSVRIGLNSGTGVELGDVSVRAESLELAESERVDLRAIDIGSGKIVASGPIYDVVGAALTVRDELILESTGEIVLADSGTGDRLHVGGLLSALAIANRGADGSADLDTIRLGSGVQGVGTVRSIIEADVRVGELDLRGQFVQVFEKDGSFLQRIIAAETVDALQNVTTGGGYLQIASGGAIQNQAFDGSRLPGSVVADVASLDANSWMVLDGTQFSELSVFAGENVSASPQEATYLRSLRNAEAVDTSEILFRDIDQAFARNQAQPLSLNRARPSSLSEIGERFDFESTHAGEYAVQVRNMGALRLSDGTMVGEGLNIYVETLPRVGSDGHLTVSGPIVYAMESAGGGTRLANGGTVLVAGADLLFENGGGVISSGFEVYHPELNAISFNGGDGTPGRLSTSRVLPPEAAQLDPSTQHYQQQVATIFGNRSNNGIDLGFQHTVAYADGSYQFFDVRESSLPRQANLLVRDQPFDIRFLTSWGGEQLPTAIVFRRAESLFLYEAGGSSDLAAESFAPTASSSFVNDVYVGAADPPLPPIPEPAPPPELPLVAPVSVLPEAPRTTIEISSPLEVRSLTENVSEIIVVAIYWEDLDRLPANERLERAEFQQLEVEAASSGSTEFLAERKREIVRLDGAKKLPVNATDEQLEGLIEDVQRNPLDYVDQNGRPLFTEPVYGIIQSDPERGETLWRLFMIRTDQLDLEADVSEATDGSAGPEFLEAEVVETDASGVGRQERAGDRLNDDGASQGQEGEKLGPFGEGLNEEAAFQMDGDSSSMLVTPAVLAAIKRLRVTFDRDSRERRRRLN